MCSAQPTAERWCIPTSQPCLREDEVHVWLLELDVAESLREELGSVLSPDERERAENFKLSSPRRRCVVSRAVLRIILGQYVQVDPDRLVFRYAPHGRPTLVASSEKSVPDFNLAHSGDLALIAVSLNRGVGVDIERQRWKDSLERIASRYFSPRECELVRAAAPAEKANCFFSLWTRKEAILKATGSGIRDLSKIEVVPELQVTMEDSGVDRWTLMDLPPISEFASALAVEGPGVRLLCWRWQHD